MPRVNVVMAMMLRFHVKSLASRIVHATSAMPGIRSIQFDMLRYFLCLITFSVAWVILRFGRLLMFRAL